MINESTPFNLAIDTLSNTASSTPLDLNAQFESHQKLKEPRSRLFSQQNPIRALNDCSNTAPLNGFFQSPLKNMLKKEKEQLPLYKLLILGGENVEKAELAIQVNDSVSL